MYIWMYLHMYIDKNSGGYIILCKQYIRKTNIYNPIRLIIIVSSARSEIKKISFSEHCLFDIIINVPIERSEVYFNILNKSKLNFYQRKKNTK